MENSKISLSQDDLERFFQDRVWKVIAEELGEWIEDIRSLLENPSRIEGYQVENDSIHSARLRGSAEAIRNILNIKAFLEERIREEQEDG